MKYPDRDRLPSEAIDALRNGNTIGAIKIVRAYYDIGLEDAVTVIQDIDLRTVEIDERPPYQKPTSQP